MLELAKLSVQCQEWKGIFQREQEMKLYSNLNKNEGIFQPEQKVKAYFNLTKNERIFQPEQKKNVYVNPILKVYFNLIVREGRIVAAYECMRLSERISV